MTKYKIGERVSITQNYPQPAFDAACQDALFYAEGTFGAGLSNVDTDGKKCYIDIYFNSLQIQTPRTYIYQFTAVVQEAKTNVAKSPS